MWEEGHRPETAAPSPSVNPNTGLQEFFDTGSLALDNLSHYFFGGGKDKNIDPERLLSHPLIRASVEANRAKFPGRTFTNWNPQTDEARATLDRLNAIKDGETIEMADRWTQSFKPEIFDKTGNTSSGLGPTLNRADLHLGLGNSNIASEGKFSVSRNGDILNIKGNVTHSLSDPYDFDPEKYPGGIASFMERTGMAEPYTMRSQWSEPVSGTVRMIAGPDGQVQRIDPRFTWDVKPYEPPRGPSLAERREIRNR